MSVKDESVDHKTANKAAARFMKLTFDIDVTKYEYYKNFNKLKNPSSDPYFFLKRYFLNKTNQFKKYKCKKVSLSKILSYKELGFIEDMRYKFLCLKKSKYQ